MKLAVMTLMFLAAMSLPFPVSAHDMKFHKGQATQGEITSVSGDRFEMKTAAGAMAVTLTATTKLEHGDQAVDKSHLKVGEHVSVFGTKLSKSTMSAREIIVGAKTKYQHASH